MKASYSGFSRHVRLVPGMRLPIPGTRNQFQLEPIRISKDKNFFSQSLASLFNGNPCFDEPRLPELHRMLGNTEGSHSDLARSNVPPRGTGPGEKGKNCAGSSRRVRKVKMIRSRVVEIDRAFDQAKPQHLRVEIEIPLGIRRDRRHMVYSGNGLLHLPSNLFRPFDLLPGTRNPQVSGSGSRQFLL